ncbi:MAG: class I lanthipeptide [Prevotellaceae bacterium]|jgi:natural product precursor|nr:class I lanthipeptide [Prevotellaceae bacterium]
MESKKIKKLSLNKETIANLSGLEQTNIVGGDSIDCFTNSTCSCVSCVQNCVGGYGGDSVDCTKYATQCGACPTETCTCA